MYSDPTEGSVHSEVTSGNPETSPWPMDCVTETESHLDCFEIMKLPQELRGKIFNFVPQEEAVGLRLVCKQWRHEVDNLYDFDGIINDDVPGWERLFNLRLRSCKIVSFYNDPPNYGLPATRIFKYPHLLKKLNMDVNHGDRANISPDNFYYILSDYGSNLVELSVYLNIPILLAEFKVSLAKFNLPSLVKLEVTASITMFTDVGADRFNHSNRGLHVTQINGHENAFDQLLRNPFPSLKSAKFELRLVGARTISKFLGSVFVFLASRFSHSGATFEEFEIQLMQGHHGLPTGVTREAPPLNDSDAELVDMQGLKQLVSLKHLRIVSSSSIGVGLWLDVMQRQGGLISLEVDVIPSSHRIYSNVISNNYATLVHLEITDLTIWEVPWVAEAGGDGEEDNDPQPLPFDLTILQPCARLKRLILDRNVLARREFECAELVNLINLPHSLQELALNFFNVFTNDFYLYFSSLKLLPQCKLTNVAITQCGTTGDYGINGSALEMLIGINSIIFVEISRLNFGSNPNGEEAIKLNRILTNFGYRENHSYFQYSKIQSILNELEQVSLE